MLSQVKLCSRCKAEKELSAFSKDKYHSSGHKSQCKVCAAGDFKAWRTENIEYARKADRILHYKRKYGLSQEHAEQLVENRNGQCLICQQEAPLVVDHCHVSGDVRGLICSACNSVLGYAKDNPQTLRNAIAYLETFYE